MDASHQLENTFTSPVTEYVYPAILIIFFIFLVWSSFSKSGKKFLENFVTGLGDVATVSVFLIGLWFLFIFIMALFFGLLGSLIP